MQEHHKPSAQTSADAHYKHRVPIQIRFNDVDRYGHVNNNAYFAFYDLGKEDYLINVLRVNYRANDVVPVVANINADFILPIFYGDKIVVETRISHLGQKSFTLQQRAVNEKTGCVVCQCSTVMVCFSLKEQCDVALADTFFEVVFAFSDVEVETSLLQSSLNSLLHLLFLGLFDGNLQFFVLNSLRN